jgi:hypothetical protein
MSRVKDSSGEYHPVSDEVYKVIRGEYQGKKCRIVLDSEDPAYMGGNYYSRQISVYFTDMKFLEEVIIPEAYIEMI